MSYLKCFIVFGVNYLSHAIHAHMHYAYHIGTLYNIAKQRMWHWNLCKVMWCSYLEDGGLIKRHVK